MKHHPLEQLRRYSPEAIASYYRFRIWQSLYRIVTLVGAFLGFIVSLQWDRVTQQVETNQPKRAIQLREMLTRLGPTYIKVGQALSTRPDLIRQDFLEELTKLQDRLPPFPNAIAFEIVEAQLGRSLSDVYEEVSPNPVAAASLGQVYRGRLKSGEDVAIKVQRPNLIPTITLDLYLMRWSAGWVARLLPLNLGHDLTLIVDEFGTKLFEEIDYVNEAKNAEKFAHNFRYSPQVKVPQIYRDYSAKKVLTLEWISGYKLTCTDEVKQAGLDPDAIVRIGVTTGLQQLLEFGFFHADPHPGNLFALHGPAEIGAQMGYIDFGMMDQLDQMTKETLVGAVVHLINKDYTELASDFVKLGFLTPETNIEPIIPALEEVFGNIIGEKVRDFNFKTITDKFSAVMYEYPFRIPAKFALIIRSLVTQEGLALSINPEFKIVEIAYPYVAQRLLTGETPSLRRRLLEVLIKDGKFRWDRLENMLAIARSDRQFDLMPTAQLGLQYLMSEEGSYLRRQIVLALTENDRLHTEEVQRLWDLIQDDIHPDRLWDAAWSAIADFSRERAASLLPAVATFNQ
ncbi:ABC1 kinase family protein [Roseofilum casamattae]|uniref:AarF/ABC1/UbiB kinase family protein n=1 Tax=Roseofilum casamattae BLCC-M143 TaxID=3022442 RepID=A0ABT7C0P9_9CYAN|nr:AarF/ABC1/UbiB kinase family protein [Roseofilum casamattae]MDJ1185019.1 AarF/ABC1/UbiB kinase family protein [Roseofilum casamattae BLCC-M143]